MIYKSYLVEENMSLLKEKIVLFYGENLGLKNDFRDNIKFENKEAEIITLEQDVVIKDKEKLFKEIFNLSLFEKKKIIFIVNTTDKILPFLEEIKDRVDEQKIFLFSDILEKKSKLRNYFEKEKNIAIIACYEDNHISLKKIVLKKLRNFNGLTGENINYIIQNTNMSRIKLNNELKKIQSYFLDKKIEFKNLVKLMNQNENNNFNYLKDEALKGNKKITNKLLSDTDIQNDKIIFYLNSINQRLTKLNSILSANTFPIEKAIDSVKPPIFWKDKPNYIEQIKKWNKKKIRQIQIKLYDVEIMLKTNININKNTLLKKILIDICNLANAS